MMIDELAVSDQLWVRPVCWVPHEHTPWRCYTLLVVLLRVTGCNVPGTSQSSRLFSEIPAGGFLGFLLIPA
jgi:hypothetical protein